ncbi:acetolactate synthase [Sporichthya polymorpha]|uniref:acetolactate synthase n=1 Tax=Sporichthya polymorpha TaxID=35751 RepID=UPI00036FE648|nr:acetolactate synthase [Sporichthya polymorpha]
MELSGSGGDLALPVLRAHGVREMFTLSGGHVFPLYDGAVKADPPMPLFDVRHEQSAVFAAEAVARLERRPGLAVLTAGPGVTNGVSAITTAHFNGSPVLVLGGRAPAGLWGAGSLQELDHPQILAPVTKLATTAPTTADVPAYLDRALRLATTPHRGPTFVDFPIDELFGDAEAALPPPPERTRLAPDGGDLDRVADLLRSSVRPVLILGSDVWTDGAEESARLFAETFSIPTVTNGQGRGVLPAGHPLLVTKARGQALGGADLVLVAGTPLDFRLGFGRFGSPDADDPTPVVHLVDAPDRLGGGLVQPAATAAGDLSAIFSGLADALGDRPGRPEWAAHLQGLVASRAAKDTDLLATDTPDIHPARILGELLPRLDPDAVMIGDGGDFVSWAGRLVEPRRPGCWLDPGPYGCLGTGLGYAFGARVARPDAQIVALLGDGAAGFSLMDVDSLVRHRMPVVLVVGNNGMWGLEKHPMQALYGYDVVADLAPQCRYDEVVTALGGAGEIVTRPEDIGPALDRALAADAPYLVNVVTDPTVAYPRTTML